MRKWIMAGVSVLAGMLSGCAGQFAYLPSTVTYSTVNSKIIELPKDKAWKQAVQNLGSSFFVINTIEKDSGLINISYSGDPQKYIDCGRITSHVKNLMGDRSYDFPASIASQEYETLENGVYLHIIRKLSLEGRINLILQEESPSTTRAIVNVKYVVTKNSRVDNGQGLFRDFSDVISFNTGGQNTFQGASATATSCKANGLLEREILEAATGR